MRAIQFASEAGMLKLELETDCLVLKTELTSNICLCVCGSIFREIKILMGINFIDVKVSYSPRSYNRVAHKLASLGAKIWLLVGQVSGRMRLRLM